MTEIIKQNDTWPYLEFSFVDVSGLPVNCVGYDVQFIVRNWKKETVIDTLVNDISGAIWVDQSLGTGEYHWTEEDTARQGRFEYEFKFTRLSDGRVFTLPQSGFLEYEVRADVPWDSTHY